MMTIFNSKPRVAVRSALPTLSVAMAALAIASAPLIGGCGNVSQGVAKDGASASRLVWPSPDSVTPMHKGGTYPEPAELQLIRYGMNKQQIAALIGYPHFDEGVWAVREWNYVFNFRQGGTDRTDVCQFKILFDEHKLARSFYWYPETCSRYMAAAVSPATAQAPEQQLSLSTDAMFKFDRSSIGDITQDGQAQLDKLAKDLTAEQNHIEDIRIRGYSDRLGSDNYDFTLSERRAYTVMTYLVGKGVPQDLIVAEGRGKSDAIAACPSLPKDALITCLAPNRRVVVQVHTRAKDAST